MGHSMSRTLKGSKKTEPTTTMNQDRNFMDNNHNLRDEQYGVDLRHRGEESQVATFVLKSEFGYVCSGFLNFVRNFRAAIVESRRASNRQKAQRSSHRDTLNKFNARLKLEQAKQSRVVRAAGRNIAGMEVIKTLGSGSFGLVVLVRSAMPTCDYEVPAENCDGTYKFNSVKIMNKERLVEMNQVEHVMSEKEILASLRSPFIVTLYESMKDNSNIFLVMEYIAGGEMFTHLRKCKRFNESLSRFFSSQVVLALEYLHSLNIIYRDLKPENIMLALTGYIKVTDFGFAKQIDQRTWTMCGTPEYLAPEIILNKGYNETVDYWALGILIYEMNAGFPPFYDSSPMKIYEKILQGRMKLLPFFSNSLRKLIKCLLHSDVTCRMGNLMNGVQELKEHEWFLDYISWDSILSQTAKSLYPMNSSSPGDTKNFQEMDEEALVSDSECMFEEDFKQF